MLFILANLFFSPDKLLSQPQTQECAQQTLISHSHSTLNAGQGQEEDHLVILVTPGPRSIEESLPHTLHSHQRKREGVGWVTSWLLKLLWEVTHITPVHILSATPDLEWDRAAPSY